MNGERSYIIYDVPGVVLTKNESSNTFVPKSCKDVLDLEEPLENLVHLFEQFSKEQMLIHFEIRDFKDIEDFLKAIAERKNFYLKKKVPDTDKAARFIISEFIEGRIKYETKP